MKKIPGFDNYAITDNGEVYNLEKNKKIKQSLSNGYLRVSLRKNGKIYCIRIHQLVAKTFIKNTNIEKEQVDHIDGNKQNNTVSNLRWATRDENNKNRKFTTRKQLAEKIFELIEKGHSKKDIMYKLKHRCIFL